MAWFLTGIGLAAATVVSSRVSGGTGTLGADVSVQVAPTGELSVSTTGVFLSGVNLQPGSPPARGQLVVRNQTGSTLAVRVRALPSVPDLDGLLWLRVGLTDETVFDAALGGLRMWSDHPFHIGPGDQEPLRVQAWFPREVQDGYQGRIADIALEMQAEPVRP